MSRQEDFGLVLAAAGLGSRFESNVPKQFWEVNNKPLYLHALEPFLDLVGEAVVVVPGSWENKISAQLHSLLFDTPIRVNRGGSTRQESVSHGLCSLSSSTKYVLVHDAARPFISAALIELVMSGTRKWGACIPVIPVRDTIIRAGTADAGSGDSWSRRFPGDR
jgi:2-C-methyl-D-erythritol 4-phosphate cytidylyltransferase